MDEARKDERHRRLIFELFQSRAYVGGEQLLFDSSTSARLKRQAVSRGFTDQYGRMRRTLSPLERMVMRMRAANTGDSYDHEWWADWTSTAAWFKNFHQVMLESWLFYPAAGAQVEPRPLGAKIGYEFEYKRRKFERAIHDCDYLERWRAAEAGEPEPVELPPELKNEKIVYHFPIDGFLDWREYSLASLKKLQTLQAKILRLVPKLHSDGVLFTKGMAEGGERAQAVDLDTDLLGREERDQILRILERDYELIAQLRNRREIADLIVSRLPPPRQKFLKNEAQHRAFTERLRHTYFSKIGLRPAARGMPRKSAKIVPRRSRILIYTPDIASADESTEKSI